VEGGVDASVDRGTYAGAVGPELAGSLRDERVHCEGGVAWAGGAEKVKVQARGWRRSAMFG
jgi:hypothetical protein